MPGEAETPRKIDPSLLRAPPPPLVDRKRRVIVVWSPKSACTATYVWFANLCGFLDEMRRHDEAPHRHRMDIFRLSRRYLDGIAAATTDFHVVRIIRDPYARAVSIFREALTSPILFADRDARLAGLDFARGVSFQRFLQMIDRFDMENVDTHYRPQLHNLERVRKPHTVINISKTDLFAGLNALEERQGWPKTDFAAMGWLHALEESRRPPRLAHAGTDDMFRTPIPRAEPKEQTPFPDYRTLLTPEAKALIESIYREDFEAYQDFL